MSYFTIKYLHITGFMLMFSALVSVFIADLRLRRTPAIHAVHEAARYIAVFQNRVFLPGALLAGVSGVVMTLQIRFGFFGSPWLTAMWLFFIIQVVEINTFGRAHFTRMLAYSGGALKSGVISDNFRREQRRMLPNALRSFDLPLFFLTLASGEYRFQSWGEIALWAIAALLIGLGIFVYTRRAGWSI